MKTEPRQTSSSSRGTWGSRCAESTAIPAPSRSAPAVIPVWHMRTVGGDCRSRATIISPLARIRLGRYQRPRDAPWGFRRAARRSRRGNRSGNCRKRIKSLQRDTATPRRRRLSGERASRTSDHGSRQAQPELRHRPWRPVEGDSRFGRLEHQVVDKLDVTCDVFSVPSPLPRSMPYIEHLGDYQTSPPGDIRLFWPPVLHRTRSMTRSLTALAQEDGAPWSSTYQHPAAQ